MKICLIDTSIFLEILNVPSKSQEHEKTLEDLKSHVEAGCNLFLPMATIIETGNHIAQNGNSAVRREMATRFVKMIKATLANEAPWSPTSTVSIDTMESWLDQFPDYAMRDKTPKKEEGTSFGDLIIIKDWEKFCKQNPHSEVFIWSKDSDLQALHQNKES